MFDSLRYHLLVFSLNKEYDRFCLNKRRVKTKGILVSTVTVNEERIAVIHTLTPNDAVNVLNSRNSGLSEAEVVEIRQRVGKNIIDEM